MGILRWCRSEKFNLCCAVLFAAGFAACSSTSEELQGPKTAVFSDPATCTDLTGGDQCGVVMCDFVPEGKTFEETCGPYFQEGFTSSSLDEAAIERIVEIHLLGCWYIANAAEHVVEARDPDDNWIRISGPDTWLDSVTDLIGADCEA